ncbi:complex I assembly factor ACAD9, mitochondrial-like isoform X2 [Periplaneta americana]|uniref:complex I assembly factor ACAD9, mitochondrial-like isoform X2 n=1 Tax=Periplaneta americana TaxID=6978 RepID=UPI0037E9B4CB
MRLLNVDSKEIDMTSEIPKEILDQLKAFGLFGHLVPEEYGGLGLNATECARIDEVTGLDMSIAVTLAAHQAIGLKGLLIAGNEGQKNHYLPRLAKGECIAAFCLTESEAGSDASSIQSRAFLSDDKKTWILNGKKSWITNGGVADLFIVFAKTEISDHIGQKRDVVTAFLVERNFIGVSSGKAVDKLGVKGSNTCEVNFDNTPVPVENVLGVIGEGYKIAMDILNNGRFSMSSSSVGLLKKLIGLTAEHAITRRLYGKGLSEFDLVQGKFAILTCATYAVESMIYLTTGMLDTYEDPDCAMEIAIVKVFSSENCWKGVNECLQLLGVMGYMTGHPYERMLRDCRMTMTFEGTNELLRLFISLLGIQHAGLELRDTVKKMRNPLMNPGFVLHKAWQQRQQANDSPKLNLGLDGYLHPSLQSAAKLLEYCVLRLQYGVEIVLARHGEEIVENQMMLKRLADVVIDIYAITAVLARSSRSYCIGLPHADQEINMAVTFCHDAHLRVRNNITAIERGPVTNNDNNYKSIAKQVFNNRGYFAAHPLSRNY